MEQITSILTMLQDTSLGLAIGEGEFAFPLLECVHVVALTVVLGTIAIADLRLIGLRPAGDSRVGSADGRTTFFRWSLK